MEHTSKVDRFGYRRLSSASPRRAQRKMKLIAVRNTFEGEAYVGCRAVGVHKGYYIERTEWAPVVNLESCISDLERIATWKYNQAIKEIEELITGS
ncbi:MAG: hypothetical protein K2O78_09130 [Muribaculaceae bacterium]|nr:hypothetical protein [Muribaculaceae bacterium]